MKTKTNRKKTVPKVEVKKGFPMKALKTTPKRKYLHHISNHCKFYPLLPLIYKFMQQRERGCLRKAIQAGLLLVSC